MDYIGRRLLAVGSPSKGHGHSTSFAQIAAERIGVPIETVRVVSGDTALAAGMGTFASRMMYDGGNAVADAAREVRERLLQRAADALEAAPEDLELTGGRVSVKGFAERGVTVQALAREAGAAGERIHASATFEPEHSSVWAGGVNAATVEVDIEMGHVSIRWYVVVHDSGVMVNPMLVEGQVEGGVAHGIGNTLLEACVYSPDGQLLTATFADYAIPLAETVPDIEIIHVEIPSPFSREGVKGASESGTIAAIPTVVSAVEDALAPFGIRIDDVPISAERIALAVAEARRIHV